MSSEDDVALVDAAYRAWREQGVEGLLPLMHPEIEWHPPAQAPEPGPFRGREEILRMVDSYLESFGEFMPVPERILAGAGPGQVVVLANLTTRGRDSGAEFTMEVGHLLTVRDGKVVRFEVFTDRDAALAAAGLSSR